MVKALPDCIILSREEMAGGGRGGVTTGRLIQPIRETIYLTIAAETLP
jgi:hypothetical protein